MRAWLVIGTATVSVVLQAQRALDCAARARGIRLPLYLSEDNERIVGDYLNEQGGVR